MRALLNVALALSLLVVTLGAYVRLSDAGLGCPDWPGCYGQLLGVPEVARGHYGGSPELPMRVDTGKAWKEMLHRYAGGTLGLLILAIAAFAWIRNRQALTLPTLLLGLVILQGLLGMLTVTLQLKPIVVTAHLLGGMAIMGLLFRLRLDGATPAMTTKPLFAHYRVAGQWALLMLAIQIGLGGWVSSHEAALACPDFPVCRAGAWFPTDVAALIHVAHRAGALLVLVVVGHLIIVLLRRRSFWSAFSVALALLLQTVLGITNVLLQWPLLLAVAHNAGAALLLLTVVFADSRLRQMPPHFAATLNEG